MSEINSKMPKYYINKNIKQNKKREIECFHKAELKHHEEVAISLVYQNETDVHEQPFK